MLLNPDLSLAKDLIIVQYERPEWIFKSEWIHKFKLDLNYSSAPD